MFILKFIHFKGINISFVMLFLCFVDYTLNIEGRSNVSGSLDIKFLNISGRICADDWDDKDASVACRELGYSKG